MEKDTVEVLVIQQGDAVCGTQGYMLKKSSNIAAFYLDGWVRLAGFILHLLVGVQLWVVCSMTILTSGLKTDRKNLLLQKSAFLNTKDGECIA